MIELDSNSQLTSAGAVIRAIGVGGGGCNAIDNIKKDGVTGVDFIAANSDVQALKINVAEMKIQVGEKTAKGLGVGGNPEIGKKCIEESADVIRQHLEGSNMVFIAAGMGGGTGTGGAPQIAKIAKELQALVVAVVTTPFKYEGGTKIKYALDGIEELKKNVDSIIVVSNQKIIDELDRKTNMLTAFKEVDAVLINASKGVVDIINKPGFINIDFADIRNVLQNSGEAVIGVGSASGENSAIIATENALNSPLTDKTSIRGAKGILINITTSPEFSVEDLDLVTNLVLERAGGDPFLKSGIAFDENMKSDEIMVTILATQFDQSVEIGNDTPRRVEPQVSNSVPEPAPEVQLAPAPEKLNNRVARSNMHQQQGATPAYTRGTFGRRSGFSSVEPQQNTMDLGIREDARQSSLREGTNDMVLSDDGIKQVVSNRTTFLRKVMD